MHVYVHVVNLKRQEFRCLEFFAGKGNLHRVFRLLGRLKSARFDVLDEPATVDGKTNFMDLTSTSGYALLGFRWWGAALGS